MSPVILFSFSRFCSTHARSRVIQAREDPTLVDTLGQDFGSCGDSAAGALSRVVARYTAFRGDSLSNMLMPPGSGAGDGGLFWQNSTDFARCWSEVEACQLLPHHWRAVRAGPFEWCVLEPSGHTASVAIPIAACRSTRFGAGWRRRRSRTAARPSGMAQMTGRPRPCWWRRPGRVVQRQRWCCSRCKRPAICHSSFSLSVLIGSCGLIADRASFSGRPASAPSSSPSTKQALAATTASP